MNAEDIKILIVEDTDLDFDLFSRLISRYLERPHTITNAENQATMISLLEEKSFDIIFLDLGLPDSVEFDSIDAIRRADKNVRIFVLSGTETFISKEEAQKMGVEEFIVKSDVGKETLGEAIKRALN